MQKIYPADLDSPLQELFIRGLGFIVAPLVRFKIDFLSARIGRSIQPYNSSHLRVKQTNDICVARCVRHDLDVRFVRGICCGDRHVQSHCSGRYNQGKSSRGSWCWWVGQFVAVAVACAALAVALVLASSRAVLVPVGAKGPGN